MSLKITAGEPRFNAEDKPLLGVEKLPKRLTIDEAGLPLTANDSLIYRLVEGSTIRFRHASPEDAELIADAIRTASAETLLHRFFTPIRSIGLPQLRELLTIDYPTNLCLVGEVRNNDERRIVCGARLVRESIGDSTAEFAVTVHDDYQRLGLGRLLLRQLCEYSLELGIEQLTGSVLGSNRGMLNLLAQVAPHAERRHVLGSVVVTFNTSRVSSQDFCSAKR